MELPSISDIYHSLSQTEFQQIESNFLNDQSLQSKFNYAWALCKQPYKNDQRKALFQFQKTPGRRKEVLYYLALVCYKLGELEQSKQYLNTLLQIDGQHKHGLVLLSQVNEQIKNDGFIGMAIVGGLLTGAAAIAAAIIGSKKK